MQIIDKTPVTLKDGLSIDIEFIAESVIRVNQKFIELKMKTQQMALNVFKVIDFRMLSGLVGETLITEISDNHSHLEKNPNIDGYPDLMNASKPKYQDEIKTWKSNGWEKFIKYPHGGIEVKNTFGTKRNKVNLAPGNTRIGKINNKLDWKAHHRYTNNLLALLSDYIDECPQIVAIMFSNKLVEADWKEKQNPKQGSTMTSFSVIERSGWEKLKAGLRICKDEQSYKSFFE